MLSGDFVLLRLQFLLMGRDELKTKISCSNNVFSKWFFPLLKRYFFPILELSALRWRDSLMGNLHGQPQQQQLQDQFVQQEPHVPRSLLGLPRAMVAHGWLELPQPQAKVLPCGIQPQSPQVRVVRHSCCGLQWVHGLNKGFAIGRQVESVRW